MILKSYLSPILPLLFLALLPCSQSVGQSGGDQGGAGLKNYRLGCDRLLEGNRQEALAYFRKAAAAGDETSARARIQIIRLLALEGKSTGRLQALRQELNRIEDEEYQLPGWFAAVQALHNAGYPDEALTLALEMPYRFPGRHREERIAGARFTAAQILVDRRQYAGALDQLFRILEEDPDFQGRYGDDACFLIAFIFSRPGPFYSPRKALGALAAFHRFAGQPAFRNSRYREEVERLSRILRGYE